MNFEQMIGFGVAGNFAGHLEQAGEAADFTQVKTENAIQPISLRFILHKIGIYFA